MFMHYCSLETTVKIIRVISNILGEFTGHLCDLGCGIPFLSRSLDLFWPGYVSGVDLPSGFILT